MFFLVFFFFALEETRKERENEPPPPHQMNWNEWLKEVGRENCFFFSLVTINFLFSYLQGKTFSLSLKIYIRYTVFLFSLKKKTGKTMDDMN